MVVAASADREQGAAGSNDLGIAVDPSPDELRAEVAALRAENARLRGQRVGPGQVQVHLADFDGPRLAAEARFQLIARGPIGRRLRRGEHAQRKHDTLAPVLGKLLSGKHPSHRTKPRTQPEACESVRGRRDRGLF